MGDSNNGWGELASFDQELAAAFDDYDRLPEPGEHEILDAFVARKNLTIPALVRVGARLTEANTLAFGFPGLIKYRDMLTDRRWSYTGSEPRVMKIVPAGLEPTEHVLVCEGETDGAWLATRYDSDVAIMPGGAGYFPVAYADQLRDYTVVLSALDADRMGEIGSAKIAEQLPNTVRFPPPASKDWCTHEGEPPPLPTREDLPTQDDLLLVSAGDLLTLETPDVVSWFEHALLPIGGQLVLHGWVKSFKSFAALDMLAALAQGQDWACFEPTEEPCKVAVIQYEITWPYYKERVQILRSHAREPGLFDENFLTFSPLRRPELTAGNRKQEDLVLRTLIEAGVQVVLIDPIRRASGAIDMNSEKDVRAILRLFERLQDEGITVVTTHHDNKEFARRGGGDALGMTGAGAFSGDADSIVSIELPTGEDHRSSVRRNLQFTIRNGPSIGGRGMEIQEDGRLLYSPHSWASAEEPDEADEPAI